MWPMHHCGRGVTHVFCGLRVVEILLHLAVLPPTGSACSSRTWGAGNKKQHQMVVEAVRHGFARKCQMHAEPSASFGGKSKG
jgi:hypothetical protein